MFERGFILLICFIALKQGFTQENITYQLPPDEILELAEYTRPPSVNLDSRAEYMLLFYRNTYKTLDELNLPEMRLGGLRINPVTNISSTITYVNDIKVRKAADRKEMEVKGLPDEPKLSYIRWSPDEQKVAFLHTSEKGVELWVLHVKEARAERLTEANLNANAGNPFSWYQDSKNLLVRMLPENRMELIDRSEALPSGPVVSEGDGEVSQNRTYQDLLKNPTDEHNFEALMQSALFRVSLSGEKEKVLDTDLYLGEQFSPDGRFLMVTTVKRPFSYIVPYYRFPQTTVVYDRNFQKVKTVNEVPLNEVIPKGFSSVRTGKRSMAWRDDRPAELYFAEALDGGDMAVEVDFRDAVYTWSAPFDSAPVELMKTKQRFGGVTWGNERVAVVEDYWYDTRNAKTYLINPSSPGEDVRIIFDRNYQDIYSDPGEFETQRNEFGRDVLAIHDQKLFLIGKGLSPEGQFPFVDLLDMNSLETERIYQSEYTDRKEDIAGVVDFAKSELLVSIQSATDYPNYYIRSLKSAGEPERLTFFENPFSALNKVYKEVINYNRNDGVALTGTLYLPEGYDFEKKPKLPLLIWAYPREYKDKNTAGQSAQNPNSFTYPYYGSFVYWVRRGYAILDNASFPIVGEGEEEPNDTFIPQLVANAEAAINALDSLGYIDRSKVAVGGHSYGAFMTANLLTHSDLFACGIARSGAYNRTLTPFGFQSEQRNYWDAPEIYHTMSPFMNAHKMKTPLLLTHGEADNNPGTFTLQTERYFQALKNLGAPVRMVILPRESHGYVAKPNIFHLLWEQDRFLEKHLKGVSE